jgi:peptide/nickel transport system substrate-binding protein
MKSVRTVAALSAATLVLSACGGGGGDNGGSAGGKNLVNGKTFTLVLPGDPGNLDPHFNSLSPTLQTDLFVYDTLLDVDANGKLIPHLADKWDATTTKATFTLRKGITCADGSPLTASTVAANISFVGNPANQSTRIGVFVPAGATATGDDASGVVTVTSPTPDAFLDVNIGGLPIVCDKGLKDRSLLKQGGGGSGMFTVAEDVADDHITLTRRKDYAWGPGDWKKDQTGLPDKVVIKIVTNPSTAANLLLSGAVNAAVLSGTDAQRVAAKKLFKRDVPAALGELWFNQNAGQPGADEHVRLALTQALDLQQIGKVVTGGTGAPVTSLVIPGTSPCTGDTVTKALPKHDVAAAKAALDAAGWTAGAGGTRTKDGKKLALTYVYPSNAGPGMASGAELVHQQWQAIGVEVTLKGASEAEIGQLAGGQGTWQAANIPLGLSLPSEAVPFLSGPTPPNGTNFAGINNADYQSDVAAASAQAGAAGCEKWAAAETAIVQHADLIPYVSAVSSVFGSGTQFEVNNAELVPGSIRMFG